jgi:flagellar hook assembly protein FlgD
VRTLVNETVAAGRQTVVWNGTDEFGARVHSGVYFYLIEAEGFRATRKMTLLK